MSTDLQQAQNETNQKHEDELEADEEENLITYDPQDPPMVFSDIKPEKGQDLVPPQGTVPTQIKMMQALTLSILRKLNDLGSVYVGDTNYYGARHGWGKMTYIDGSSYDGQWNQGLKSGQGELKMRDGTIYKGGFLEDFQEGEGQLIYANGDVFKGTWKSGLRQGKGTYIYKQGTYIYKQGTQKIKECMYENDIEIVFAEQNPDCYNRAFLSFFLAAITFGLLQCALNLHPQKDKYIWWVFFGISCLFYVCECIMSPTNTFISNLEKQVNIQKIMDQVKSSIPSVKFNIRNYHHGRKNKKVYTHEATEDYRFYEWLDQSPDAFALDYIKKSRIVRINYLLKVEYTNSASQSFNCQEFDFKKANIRDTHYEYKVINSAEGMKSDVLMLSEGRWLPWYGRHIAFWAFSLIGFSWLFRVIFVCNTRRVTYEFKKLIVR